VNVTVENLGPCKKLLRFDIEVAAVNAAFDEVAKDYQKQASLPGFRPGKAPKDMVLKRYEKEIEGEAKRKLMGDHYRNAVKEHKIEVVGYPDVEEIQFGKDQAMQFAATIETAPEFNLPEYRGLPAQRAQSASCKRQSCFSGRCNECEARPAHALVAMKRPIPAQRACDR